MCPTSKPKPKLNVHLYRKEIFLTDESDITAHTAEKLLPLLSDIKINNENFVQCRSFVHSG